MKKCFTLIVVSLLSIYTFGQNKQRFDQKVDSMLLTNRQNHNYLDTLWVLDSSRTYEMVNEALIYQRTYKVLSRNEQGNPIASLDWADEDYPYFTDNNVYDSIVYFDGIQVKKQISNAWNSVEQTWIDNSYKEFDAPDLPKVMSIKGFSNNNQEYFYGHRESYANSNGRIDTLIYETYIPETNTWTPKAKTVFYYAGQNNDTLQMFYKWTGDRWEDSAKLHRYFDSDLLTLQIGEIYNSDSDTWQNYVLYSYSYNNHGKIDTGFFQVWNPQLNIWRDNFKFIFSYDSEDRVTNRLVMHFDQNSQQLLNYQNELFEFAEGSKTEIYQNWSLPDGPWVNQTRYTTTYIADEVIDTFQLDMWNYSSQLWQPNNRIVNKYDHRLNILESEDWYYHSWDSEWQLISKTDYFWSPFIPNAIPEIKINEMDVYPNPAITQVIFVLPDDFVVQDKATSLQLFNLSGQKIAEIPIKEGKAVWNCTAVKPGLYVYSTMQNGQKITGKIVVTN